MNVLKTLFATMAFLVLAAPATAQMTHVAVATAEAGRTVAQRPEVKVGDTWTYSFQDTRFAKPACSFSLTVAEVSDTKIAGVTENLSGCDLSTLGATPAYDRDFNFLYPDGTPYRVFDFPLEVGKSWNRKFETAVGNRSWSHDMTVTVAGVESVSVKAGTFNAVKIVVARKYLGSSTFGTRWAGTTQEILWYVPEVRNFVKRITIDGGQNKSPIEQELLAYSVK